jgi:hypothetical protein
MMKVQYSIGQLSTIVYAKRDQTKVTNYKYSTRSTNHIKQTLLGSDSKKPFIISLYFLYNLKHSDVMVFLQIS